MKKLYIIILVLLGLQIQAQTFVSTTPENRNIVLEEFTGIHCTYCPDGHVIAQNLYNNNPGDVTLINIHVGGYASPNQGEPDFRTSFGSAIDAQAQVAGYPAGTVNRHQFAMSQGGGTAMGRSDWATAGSYMLVDNSPVNIGIMSNVDVAANTLIVDVEVYYTDSTVVLDNYLNVFVLQNNVPGPQIGAQSFNPGAIISGPWNPTYNHNHMFRHSLTGQWGEMISNPLPGSFYTFTYTWALPADINGVSLDITNLEIAAFIAEGNQEIITGEVVTPSLLFLNQYDANVTTSTAGDVICATETDISITFRNYGNQPLTTLDLTYDINNGTPAMYSWVGNLASGDEETVTIANVTFTPQANNTVTWLATNPNGQVDQNTTNNSNNSTFRHWNLSGDVITGITAGTIDVSIFTDGYGNETTWEIVDEFGQVYGSGGPYSNNTQYNETAYVALFPNCFDFKLYDSYGDGMMDNGVGSVIVTDQNNNVIFEGNANNLINFTELNTYFETTGGTLNSWECTPFGCADVGIGFGTYSTQLDCESDATTGCYIISSINEIESLDSYNKIFDVLGREWVVNYQELPKGMYIINNMKVFKIK
tara:strand:+ start:2077 stop:3852 length:1776 start_codon:yes stop_codon:yes gene_type:complete